MRKKWDIELTTGAFLLMGLLALAYLSISMARMEMPGGGGFTLYARFASIEGLKVGAVVEVAGVEVGRVKSIELEDYQAKVGISLNDVVKVPEDSILSIRTKGLLGEKYVRLSPGGSDEFLKPDEEILETEPPINLEELISNYMFGKI
jgi:phospholipid/cholesterol/gamma-HCH transport system substrate-binding protein